jgi:hypothetical protein
LKIAID